MLRGGVNRNPGYRDTYNMDHGRAPSRWPIPAWAVLPLFLLVAPWMTSRKMAVEGYFGCQAAHLGVSIGRATFHAILAKAIGGDGVIGLTRSNQPKQGRAHNGACYLRDHIAHRIFRGDLAGGQHGNGNGGVEVTAGYMRPMA